MGVLSWVKFHLIRAARKEYNGSNYKKSMRKSKISFFLFRDQTSLDILCRSNIRLNNFENASKLYKKANIMGFSLLDHNKNHFKSLIESEDIVGAFKLMNKSKTKKMRSIQTKSIIKKLNSYNDAERVKLIEEMNSFTNLPPSISNLLPWSPKLVKIESVESSFRILSDELISVDRHRRELSRIKNSASYQISRHLSNSVKNPLKIPLLTFSLPNLIYRIFRQKIGKISVDEDHYSPLQSINNPRDCIVLFPTNGVGFGHFTRLLAIAEQIRMESTKPLDIVFFTTMPTLHILANAGFPCYHLPGRYRYDSMEANVWNSLCEEMLHLIFSLHRPKAFIFDGAYPYRGMLNAIKSYPDDMLKVWLRKGSIKKSSKPIPVDSIGNFHAIIRPGDSAEVEFNEELSHNIPLVKTNPIIYNILGKILKHNLKSRLGIPESAIVCYVQLGAGKINDIDSELKITLDILSEYNELYVVIGESLIGERVYFEGERVRVLRDYPNSKYFKEFDFAIMAGGYNTYHEVIESQLPAISYPNLNTGRDDQLARVTKAKDNGCMIVLKNRSKNKIAIAIERIMDEEVRKLMSHRCGALRRSNGSKQVSNWILEQLKNS